MELAANRAPRSPRDLAVCQTARMSSKAVCTTDGWSVHLTSFFSGLALSPCLIIIPTWERVCARVYVCVCCCLFWIVGLWHTAGKRNHVCLVFDWEYVCPRESWMGHSVCRCQRCPAWQTCAGIWYGEQQWGCGVMRSPCYMQIGSDWISLAACWKGLRTKSICLPLLYQGPILLTKDVLTLSSAVLEDR